MSYQSEVLADSPLLYWRLGEPSGATAEDSSPSNRDGIYNGPTLGQPGLDGSADTAASFNPSGGSDVVYTNSYNPIGEGFAGQITLEALAKYVRNGSTERWMFSPRYTGATWGLWFAGDDIFFNRNTAGSGPQQWAGAAPADNVKFHLALTIDSSGNTVELFLNGISQGTKTIGSFFPNNPFFNVGAQSSETPSLGWEGILDEIALYTGLLSSARIAAHSAQANAVSETVTFSTGSGVSFSLAPSATLQASQAIGVNFAGFTTPTTIDYSTGQGVYTELQPTATTAPNQALGVPRELTASAEIWGGSGEGVDFGLYDAEIELADESSGADQPPVVHPVNFGIPTSEFFRPLVQYAEGRPLNPHLTCEYCEVVNAHNPAEINLQKRLAIGMWMPDLKLVCREHAVTFELEGQSPSELALDPLSESSF